MERSGNFYEFGPFCLDAQEQVLLRNARLVPLPAKALSTLLVLVQNHGHVVEKDVLMKEVWPDEVVEEGNLAQHIFMLRRALGETTGSPEYIETVQRRGYRFLAIVRVIDDVSALGTLARLSQIKDRLINSQAKRLPYSLAVLPFINASGDQALEHLFDGMTESLINNLSQLPMLRLTAWNTVLRYKGKEPDAQQIGLELGVNNVLVGTVRWLADVMEIHTELVDVAGGWHLFGNTYNRKPDEILEVQNDIAKQITASLKLKLTADDESRPIKRYSENTEAYQAYLRGRYYGSKHNREGLLRAIGCFRQAIEMDPNYSLAYAGVVDCYLRLATNYSPPADPLSKTTAAMPELEIDDELPEDYHSAEIVKLRREWDQKNAESELKRATESKSNYPAAHQWHAAYLFSLNIFHRSIADLEAPQAPKQIANDGSGLMFDEYVTSHIYFPDPTPSEEVQIFCTIAREQIATGNYDAGCAVLERWWTIGEWPNLEGLSFRSSADLLLTTGVLAGFVANTRQVARGQKHAEALINGSIALFEQFGSKAQVAEGQMELALCYQREGLFDLARTTLLAALAVLSNEDFRRRSMALLKLGMVEWQAGHLHDALERLNEAAEIVGLTDPWIIGRYHMELATILQTLAAAEMQSNYFDQAVDHYQEALGLFEALGNHRYAAVLENNYGYLLVKLNRLDEAESHLGRARKFFEAFADKRRCAQVNESLARLYVAAGRFDLAEQAVAQAVETLERSGQEPYLAEALTTQGRVLCRLGRHREAKRVLDRASQIAERCGDHEGAGHALLTEIEEMCDRLEDEERLELARRVDKLLVHSQEASTLERLGRCRDLITAAHESSNVQV
jgi:DNA-binding winged helix-turn-helix (wHTH) protein/Tfp pilus assembly protein PilF